MANINGINSGIDYSVFFGGSSTASSDGVDLTSYMSIKNGSYRKLLKNYYSSQKQEAKSSVGDSGSKLTKIRSSADALQKKADALSAEKLWETENSVDETSGKTKETLRNPDKLVNAVKEFADAYNSAIDAASSSETKAVLRSGGWLDTMTRKNGRLLNEVGISIGSDGKLSVNEEELKNANVTTLKGLFRGFDSYASKVSTKAAGISTAAAGKDGTYNASGAWSETGNSIATSQINSIIGSANDNNSTTSKARSEAENNLKSLKEKRDKLKKEMNEAVGYDARRSYESQISKLDKEIKDTESKLTYL